MSRKNILKPYFVITNNAMTANVTSVVSSVENLDSFTYLFDWSAGTSPVGTITLEVRHKIPSRGTDAQFSAWQALDFGETISISGASGAHSLSVQNKGFSEARLNYVRSSGSGTLNVSISGMTEGA